jgi:hypothetical protein
VVDDGGNGRHVGVVEQHQSADLQVRREVPPVERRIGEGVRAVDQDEVERARLPLAQNVRRGADPEAEALGRDPAPLAFARDPLCLVRGRGDCLVDGASGGEDDGARAGPGLECRHPRPHGALDVGERRPGEAPELRLAVEARLLVHQLLGEALAHASATTW